MSKTHIQNENAFQEWYKELCRLCVQDKPQIELPDVDLAREDFQEGMTPLESYQGFWLQAAANASDEPYDPSWEDES